MFKADLNCLAEAQRRIRIQWIGDDHYISLDDTRRLTEFTQDKVQLAHWHRILTVRFAVALCGFEATALAGVYITDVYVAFCNEMENNHYVNR